MLINVQPADQVKWSRVTVRPRKFGLESRYDWEDSIVSAIDIPARTTMRIGNAVAKAIDQRVWDVVTESVTPTTINTVATSSPWNDTTRANRYNDDTFVIAELPHEDIGRAIRAITDSMLQSYEPDTLVVSPLDYVYLVTNDLAGESRLSAA